MQEKIIPWWRRAINFALGGLRSGFGLFARPAKPVLATEPMFSDEIKEDPREEIDLSEPAPQFEMIAKEPEPPVEADPVSVIDQAPVPEIVSATEIAPEIVLITEHASIQAEKPDEVELADPVPAESNAETDIEAATEPEAASPSEVEEVVVAEPEIVPVLETQPQVEEESVLSPVAETEPAEAEIVAEAAPELIEEPDPVRESNPESEPESGDSQEADNEVVEDPAEKAEVVEEAEPDPFEDAEPEQAAEPEVEPVSDHSQEVENNAPEEPVKVEEIVEETKPEPVQEAEPEQITKPPVPEAVPETAEEPIPAQAIEEIAKAAEFPQTPEPVAEQPPVAETAQQLVPPAQPATDEKAAAKQAARQKKLDESSEESPFSVIVGQVYDGPLDLLLDLIRKQDIDIYDIPIAKITSQFLAYVNQLKAGDVDVAGEFIYTASLLIHIKSKMLLPRMGTGPEDTAEDPRRELVERLLEHERFKNAAQMLQQKQMLEAATWTNPGVREFKDAEGTEPEIAADTVDLVRIFREILERARNRPVINVEEDSVTVGQMIQFLARRLTMEDKPIALRRLLSHTRSERALIAMFLALLEMVRLQAILLRQDRQFSEIFIKKHSGFEAVMNEGLGNARDDWR